MGAEPNSPMAVLGLGETYAFDSNWFPSRAVRPQDAVALHQTIPAAANIARVSVHLIDSGGVDHGALGEAFVENH
jgi:hypothetical protein